MKNAIKSFQRKFINWRTSKNENKTKGEPIVFMKGKWYSMLEEKIDPKVMLDLSNSAVMRMFTIL